MKGISFVSRSVADEICILKEHYPDVVLSGMSEDVAMMIGLVEKGRVLPRHRVAKAHFSVIYNCKDMEDLRRAIKAFGS